MPIPPKEKTAMDDEPTSATRLTFDTRAGYHHALQAALQQALDERAREMWWMDRDFAEWPLDSDEWIQTLTEWLKLPGRRVTLLAADFGVIERVHGRFVQWRRNWTHGVHGRRPLELEAASMRSLYADDAGSAVVLHDPARFAGWAGHRGTECAEMRRQVDAILQRSEEAFPSLVLGV
jgi:hypothetical protein